VALSKYEEANKIADSKQAWIISNIGNLFSNRGFYSKAAGYLREAAQLDPDSEYAHDRLAGALKSKKEQLDRYDELIKLGRKEVLYVDIPNSPPTI
jgi:tetratricopeptide (TPR) repeat protein